MVVRRIVGRACAHMVCLSAQALCCVSAAAQVTDRVLSFRPPVYVQQMIGIPGQPDMYTAGFSVPIRPGWTRCDCSEVEHVCSASVLALSGSCSVCSSVTGSGVCVSVCQTSARVRVSCSCAPMQGLFYLLCAQECLL